MLEFNGKRRHVRIRKLILPTVIALVWPTFCVDALAQTCASVVQRHRSATVLVRATATVPNEPTRQAVGTGVIVSGTGYVLTTTHVTDFGEGAESISITGRIGSAAEAPVPMSFVDEDGFQKLALLRFQDTSRKYQGVPTGNPSDVADGDTLCVASFPVGVEWLASPTSLGGKGGPKGSWLLNSPMTEGEQGAPVFDLKGMLVALKESRSEKATAIAFATPLNLASPLLLRADVSLATAQSQGVASDRAERADGKSSDSYSASDSVARATEFRLNAGDVRIVHRPEERGDSRLRLTVIHTPVKAENYFDHTYDFYVDNPTTESISLVSVRIASSFDIPRGDSQFGGAMAPNVVYDLKYAVGKDTTLPLVPPYFIPAGGVGAFRMQFRPDQPLDPKIEGVAHIFTIKAIDSEGKRLALIGR